MQWLREAYIIATPSVDLFIAGATRVHLWPEIVPPAVRAGVVAEALQIMLEVSRQGYAVTFMGNTMRPALSPPHASVRLNLVEIATAPAATVPPEWRAIVAALPPLSRADAAALRRIVGIDKAAEPAAKANAAEMMATAVARAARDAEKHGLRHCTLPACDALEAHPKAFKTCGRCRARAYCCTEHAAADWKRHKREDGCKAPDADAGAA